MGNWSRVLLNHVMSLRYLAGRVLRKLRPLPAPLPASRETWARLAAGCRAEPAAPESHLALARHFAAHGQALSAHACYRTARALGASAEAELEKATSPLLSPGETTLETGSRRPVSHVETMLECQRLTRVAGRVHALLPGRSGNLLDVGGGNGALALLLPDCNYFLADPLVNGLTSADAARYNRRFDIVTCCHVLEHIPEEHKTAFVADLAARATGHVLILGPSIDTTPPPPVDRIFEQITGQDWAKEHLVCGWPRVADLRAFADRNKFGFSAAANGNLAAMYWMVFAHHYAALAGREGDIRKITAHFNREICPDPLAPPPPNDYLVEFRIAGPAA